jgi:hypothetical protein
LDRQQASEESFLAFLNAANASFEMCVIPNPLLLPEFL